jgi:methionine-rich copper-binding protein CopC
LSKRVGDKCSYCFRHVPIIIIASLLFLSYMLISTIPRAYAHAYVIGSDTFPSQSLPKAPSSVVVHLSEPVDIRYSSVKVLGPGGNQIDKKDDHYVNGEHTTWFTPHF